MNTQDLKTNVMKESETKKPQLNYDEVLDTIFLYFTENETERIVAHFVDDNVALLYRNSDKEIVGVRIEYFKEEFLPKIAGKSGWKLSDIGEKLDGNVDFNFRAIEMKTIYTRPLNPAIEQLTIPQLKKKFQFERV